MIIHHHHWRLHPAAPLCPRGCVDDQVRWNERPKRMIQSKVKIQCACRGCGNARFDCKNKKSYEASPNDVALNMCRPVRKDCKLLRFCCKEHLRRCQPIDSEKRGPREGMTPPQVALLVDILLKSGAPWAVPLVLLQIMTGERCGRCRPHDEGKSEVARFGFLPIDHRKGHGEDTRAFHCPHSMVARYSSNIGFLNAP